MKIRADYIIFLLLFSACSVNESSKLVGDVNAENRGALLTTDYANFEEFEKAVRIDYREDSSVVLSHSGVSMTVTSELSPGIAERDFIKAEKGNYWDKAKLGLSSPQLISDRVHLLQVYVLARRRYDLFGEGDIAFYDFALKMVEHMDAYDTSRMTGKELSEKGYLNTFNHITAQAFMTTVFSENMADFISDVHERNKLPELMTGTFSEEQREDIDNGPVDNYIDMINNEWGQEAGKKLKTKYSVDRQTIWTPELLANYLNDMQAYFSYTLGIGFEPFRSSDDEIQRFSRKMKKVMNNPDSLMK